LHGTNASPDLLVKENHHVTTFNVPSASGLENLLFDDSICSDLSKSGLFTKSSDLAVAAMASTVLGEPAVQADLDSKVKAKFGYSVSRTGPEEKLDKFGATQVSSVKAKELQKSRKLPAIGTYVHV